MPKVTIAGHLVADAAFVADQTWNGWVQPMFTAAQVRAFTFEGEDGIPVILEQADANAQPEFIMYEDGYESPLKFVGTTVPGFDEPLYDIGAGFWVWELLNDDADPSTDDADTE